VSQSNERKKKATGTITCHHCRYERPAAADHCHICGYPWAWNKSKAKKKTGPGS
jgi:hypothetical protein